MPTTDKINLTPATTTEGPFKGRKPLFELELNGIVTRTKKTAWKFIMIGARARLVALYVTAHTNLGPHSQTSPAPLKQQ